MDQTDMTGKNKEMLSKPSVIALMVLGGWFAFFVALLAGSRNDGVTPPPAGGIELSGTAPGASLSLEDQPNADDTNPLDQKPPTFNFAQLTIPVLQSTLRAAFDLEFTFPPEASDIEMMALEKGGRPLGQILAELLAPHGHAVYVQENRVVMVPVQYPDRNDADGIISTTFDYDWSKPVTLWLASRPVTRIEIDAQPLSGESEAEQVGFTVKAGFGPDIVLNSALHVRTGEGGEVLNQGLRKLRLKLVPQAVDASSMTLKVMAQVSS